MVIKPSKNDKEIPGYINIGLYKLNKSVFSSYHKVEFSLEKDLFPVLVNEKNLKAVNINTRFIDIGIPEDYHTFCKSKK